MMNEEVENEKEEKDEKWNRDQEENKIKNRIGNGGEEQSALLGASKEEEEDEQKWNQVEREKGEEDLSEEERIAASKFTCFEDLVEAAGSCGRWNICLFLLCSLATFFCAFVSMSYQFLGVTPDYWCHVGVLRKANWTQEQILHLAIPFSNQTGQHSGCSMYDYNYTKAALMGYDAALAHLDDLTDHGGAPKEISCHRRDFNKTQHESSIVTEWDLVCERRVLYATTQAVNQLGFLFAYIIGPPLIDLYGRRPVSLVVVVLSLLLGMLSCLALSAEVFIALRCLLSTTSPVLYFSCFLIVAELCSNSSRTVFCSLFPILWGLGVLVLPGVAYLVRPWRYLQAALVLPSAVMLSSFWLLPESPRWLLLKGLHEDAEVILMRIAAVNRRQLPPRRVLQAALKRIARQIAADSESKLSCESDKEQRLGQKVARFVRHQLSPCRTSTLACRMVTLLVMWFSVSFVYYGVSLNATNISADPYLYMFLGGVCEVVAYLLLWLLADRVGRRLSTIGLFLMCSVCIATNALVMFTTPDVSVATKITLSLVGKLGITAGFHLLYFFTAELFTTQERSLAVGHNSIFARIGSVISPYVNDILGERAAWAPSAVFSCMALLSASLGLLLPETRNRNLPEQDLRPTPAPEAPGTPETPEP